MLVASLDGLGARCASHVVIGRRITGIVWWHLPALDVP
jgi:hypothetical protein